MTKRNLPSLIRKILGTPQMIILIKTKIHVIKSTREATEMEIRPCTLVLFKAQLIYDAFKLFIYFFEVSEEVKKDFLVDSHGMNFSFTGKKENYYQKRIN